MAAIAHPLLTISQLSVRPARRRDGRVAQFAATLREWRQRSRERAALARLTPRELADFGASSADVHREITAPFWGVMPPC
jgi:uncharacterized protein YjiS (DUF1127 family)